MMRLLLVLLVLLLVGVGVPGCEDDQSSSAAELGIQEGRRPVKSEKRPPPGPGEGGFQMGEDDEVPGEPPPPPPDN